LANGYRAHFPGLADFDLLDEGSAVWCQPLPGTDSSLCRQLLLGHVLPLLLTLRGELVLHASGIVTPVGGVLFVGPTGSGKSTLAASLGQAHQVLGDDCLVLGEQGNDWQVYPSIPAINLRTDIAPALAAGTILDPLPLHRDKLRLRPARQAELGFAARPATVRRIYFLAPPAEKTDVVIAPIPAQAAFLELVKNAFPLGTSDTQAASRFQRLARLAAGPALRWLSYPRELDRLSAVAQAILADVADSSA
jgi:hypothetical protein